MIYGAKKKMPLNKHRLLCFEKVYGPKKGKGPFVNLKGVDTSSIPLCEDVIQQKIHRNNLWLLCGIKHVKKFSPKNLLKEWELIDNMYKIVWLTGSQMPDTVLPDSGDQPEEDDSDERVT